MIDAVIFWPVAALSVAATLAVVTARNLVHAALAMVVAFAMTAVLYLALSAAFIAVVQVIVYAGAIMVLFVFVVMLIGRHDVNLPEPIGGRRGLGLAAVISLGALLAWAGASGVPAAARDPLDGLPPPPPDGFGSPAAIGERLFREWVFPVEVVSILLLAAILGVIVVARSGGLRGRAIEGQAEAGE